jgi:uroporphyrinogen-III synthase
MNDALPLAGKRILITRAAHQAGEFLDRLAETGAEAESLPTIAVVDPTSWNDLDEAIRKLREQSAGRFQTSFYEWVFFTSVNGVEWFFKRVRELGFDLRLLGGTRVCAIGTATAEALLNRDIAVDLIPREFKAEGVIESFLETHGGPDRVAGVRVLLPRARVARDVLPVELRKLGVQIDIAETYQTVKPAIDVEQWKKRLLAGEFETITFTSSSTVSQFAELFEGCPVTELLARTRVACIGPITGDTARKLGLTVDIQPTEYTIPALTRSIAEFFSAHPGGLA